LCPTHRKNKLNLSIEEEDEFEVTDGMEALLKTHFEFPAGMEPLLKEMPLFSENTAPVLLYIGPQDPSIFVPVIYVPLSRHPVGKDVVLGTLSIKFPLQSERFISKIIEMLHFEFPSSRLQLESSHQSEHKKSCFGNAWLIHTYNIDLEMLMLIS